MLISSSLNIDTVNDGLFCETSEIEVSIGDMAFGHSPLDYCCPEGSRVIAMMKPNKLNNKFQNTEVDDKLKPTFFSGTVAVKPMTQNRFEYLIFFDNNIDAYVDIKDIRVLLQQPIDLTSQQFCSKLLFDIVQQRNPFRESQPNPRWQNS